MTSSISWRLLSKSVDLSIRSPSARRPFKRNLCRLRIWIVTNLLGLRPGHTRIFYYSELGRDRLFRVKYVATHGEQFHILEAVNCVCLHQIDLFKAAEDLRQLYIMDQAIQFIQSTWYLFGISKKKIRSNISSPACNLK